MVTLQCVMYGLLRQTDQPVFLLRLRRSIR